jgi:starch phosphorylase
MNPVGSNTLSKETFLSTEFGDQIDYHLSFTLGKRRIEASTKDYFQAVAWALRPYILKNLWQTEDRYNANAAKRMYYLSLEFLIGRCLRSNLWNLGLLETCREWLAARDVSISDVLEAEPDPALGNGGLGRLAACFLDSLASLNMPGYGYGINYEFGLFKQEIRNGYQFEVPDQWFPQSSPWMVEHTSQACLIPVYGRIESSADRTGEYNPMWMDWRLIVGIPYDMPIVGQDGKTVNFLRLYSARSSKEFDMSIFNSGDYVRAMEQKISSENISKVLYPSDSVPSGRELRLLQEYFLVACAVRDIMNRFNRDGYKLEDLPNKVAIQLNDTHPALTVVELMRMLVDEQEIPWDKAWEWTRAVCGYTNHTLMAEALEKWPVSLLEYVIPRHLQIILEINHRFLREVRGRWPNDEDRVSRVSLIQEGGEKHVRMAHLAITGSHAINGVSKLHSRLITESLVPDFATLWPERFHNKTNGVNHRRWLIETNPALTSLINERIGDSWMIDPCRLENLREHCWSQELQEDFFLAKREAKLGLAHVIREMTGVALSTETMFDVQIKRIHEYKRQLLNVLAIIDQYLALTRDGVVPVTPRTWIFGGKAAPGYFMAKLIIKLVNSVSRLIASDKRTDGLLAVVFVPDYKVSLAEKIIPAADLSEQISTAGMEASGTGNMKLSMNGALTVGTLDGANIEIREAVGAENIYTFGLTAEQVAQHKRNGTYNSLELYLEKPRIRRVVEFIGSADLSPSEPGIFAPIQSALLEGGDPYFHLADLESYLAIQNQIGLDYQDQATWAAKAIKNISGMGYFSSDRTIREYARDTWNIHSYPEED